MSPACHITHEIQAVCNSLTRVAEQDSTNHRSTGRRYRLHPATRRAFCREITADHPLNRFPLVVLVDDSEFAARTLNNFLWSTFTRSNPAADIHGIESFIEQKHWGCRGSLVIDARIKPHHAPPLIENPQITRRVDALAAPGGPLHGVI